MSYLHIAPPRLLTVADYLAIGEIEPGYTELVEAGCSSPDARCRAQPGHE